MPAPGYGNRTDGTPKGTGYFGEIARPDGKVSTELAYSVNLDGKDMEIPFLVPTLTREEIDHLLQGGKPTDDMIQKAVQHARERLDAGKSPFAGDGEQVQLPEAQTPEQQFQQGFDSVRKLNDAVNGAPVKNPQPSELPASSGGVRG